MRQTMEKMEEERAEMIAEVEAQIERALANMAVEAEDSECGSRPSSRLSSRSAPGSYAAFSRTPRGLRSFGTDSTLVESLDDGLESDSPRRFLNETLAEVEEEEEEEPKKKRFSNNYQGQDGMSAVDEGISQKSDKIAQKVLEIQRKVGASG